MKEKEHITIGQSYDGFRLEYKDYEIYIDQEDNQAEKLAKFFEKLGYNVTIEENF